MNDDRVTRDQETVDSDGQGRADAAFARPRDQPLANGDPLPSGPASVSPEPGRDNRGGAGPRPSRGAKHRKGRSWWVELPVLFAFALILALLIKTFVIQAFYIPSSSMEDTLDIGDKVLVNKLIYDFRQIHRGDIVVFNGDGSWNASPAPSKPPLVRLWDAISGLFGTAPGVHDYIKRVIGVPGDHVACCDARGRITVNGVPLNEKSYLYPGNAPSAQPFHVTVPPGRLWVMGDHREVSWDSRGHMSDPGNGTIPEDKVVGRAFLIIAPVSRWRALPIPATFEQPRLAVAAPRSRSALSAAPAPLGAAAPVGLGLVGAFPLTWLERRLRLRRRRRRPGYGRVFPGPRGRRGPPPRGGPLRGTPVRAGERRAGERRAGERRAGQRRAGQRRAGQRRAGQGRRRARQATSGGRG